MSTRPLHLRLAVLALGAALILPWSAAAEPDRQALSLGAEEAAPAPSHLLAQAWSLLVSLWGEIGCGIDPDGRCAPEAATTPSDIGCIIDPSGLAAAATEPQGQSDIGCILDPDG